MALCLLMSKSASDIRTAISKVTEQWEELDKLYRIKANKNDQSLATGLVSRSDLKDSMAHRRSRRIFCRSEAEVEVTEGECRPSEQCFPADLEAKSMRCRN